MEWIWPFQGLNNGVHDFMRLLQFKDLMLGLGFLVVVLYLGCFLWGFGLVLVCLGFLSVKMHRPFINIFHEANVVI